MFAYVIFLQQGQWHKTPPPKRRPNFTHMNCTYKIQNRVWVLLCSGIRRKKDGCSIRSSLQVTTSSWHPRLCRINFWNHLNMISICSITTTNSIKDQRNWSTSKHVWIGKTKGMWLPEKYIIAHCFLMTFRGSCCPRWSASLLQVFGH